MRPIGVFDSGLGGLTVLRSMIDLLPNDPVVYFGDTVVDRAHWGQQALAFDSSHGEAIAAPVFRARITGPGLAM